MVRTHAGDALLMLVVVRGPVVVFRIAGLNRAGAEASRLGRLYRLISLLVTIVLGVTTFLANLAQIGWLDDLRRILAGCGITLP